MLVTMYLLSVLVYLESLLNKRKYDLGMNCFINQLIEKNSLKAQFVHESEITIARRQMLSFALCGVVGVAEPESEH